MSNDFHLEDRVIHQLRERRARSGELVQIDVPHTIGLKGRHAFP